MNKNYYLLFGSKVRSKEDLKNEFVEKLDMDFEKRESLYLGLYHKYSGIYADLLRIEENLVSDDYKERAFKEYNTLIYLTYDNGKNKDKKSRASHLKKVIVDHFENVLYLRERILNDDDKLIEEVSEEKIEETNRLSRKNFK